LSYVNANLPLFNDDYDDSDNAMWDGYKMIYGQGTALPPLTALDICAHEIGHGVCQFSAGLAYSGESGAINESLSDIWGACVENWATTGKQTWLIGEDLGSAIRSMSNPGLFQDPDTYGAGPYWQGSNANVHANSGIMNYWFYLLCNGGSGTNDKGHAFSVTGIGMEKAAKIVYRAETVYMTSGTNFINARTHTIAAAIDHYGSTSAEAIAVTNAWHAVGVGTRFSFAIEVISGPNSAYHYPNTSSSGAYYSYTASPVFAPDIATYVWSTVPGTSSLAPYRHTCLVRFNAPGSYVVRCHTIPASGGGRTNDVVKNILVTTASNYSLSQPLGKQIVLTGNGSASNLTSKNTTVSYTLFSQSSSAVASGQMPAVGGTLDFTHLPAGFYVLQIDMGNNQIDTYKIILK
jgi:hypothetical protein